jgi:hypothetical protein
VPILLQMTESILMRVIEFNTQLLRYQAENPATDLKAKKPVVMLPWEAAFLDKVYSEGVDALFAVLTAANFLACNRLILVACEKVATLIRNKVCASLSLLVIFSINKPSIRAQPRSKPRST